MFRCCSASHKVQRCDGNVVPVEIEIDLCEGDVGHQRRLFAQLLRRASDGTESSCERHRRERVHRLSFRFVWDFNNRRGYRAKQDLLQAVIVE